MKFSDPVQTAIFLNKNNCVVKSKPLIMNKLVYERFQYLQRFFCQKENLMFPKLHLNLALMILNILELVLKNNLVLHLQNTKIQFLLKEMRKLVMV